MFRKMIPALLMALSLPVAAQEARQDAAQDAAQEPQPPEYGAATLTGDWAGKRSALWRNGWAFDAALKVDAFHNRGGIKDGGRAMTNLDLKLAADLEKIFGWQGATAYFHVLDNRGEGVNALYTGSLSGVSNIEVPVPTTRLFQAWVQQNLFDDRFSVLFGIYPIDSEFFAMESAALLTNPSFGTPSDIALTRGPSIFNNAALGLRAKWLSADRTLYGMAAVLDGVPNDPAHPKRTTVNLSREDGAFYIGEVGWTPLEKGHVFEPTEPVRGLQSPEVVSHEKYDGVSKLALGAWRYSARVDDQFDTDDAGNPRRRHSQGAYLLGERTLFSLGAPGRDVGIFARVSVSDGHSHAFDEAWNLGFRVRGPLASRPDDALVVALARNRFSSKYRAAQAAAGTDTAAHEDLLEVSSRVALTRYLAVQPVFQTIAKPGGAADAKRANLLGLRLETVF